MALDVDGADLEGVRVQLVEIADGARIVELAVVLVQPVVDVGPVQHVVGRVLETAVESLET